MCSGSKLSRHILNIHVVLVVHSFLFYSNIESKNSLHAISMFHDYLYNAEILSSQTNHIFIVRNVFFNYIFETLANPTKNQTEDRASSIENKYGENPVPNPLVMQWKWGDNSYTNREWRPLASSNACANMNGRMPSMASIHTHTEQRQVGASRTANHYITSSFIGSILSLFVCEHRSKSLSQTTDDILCAPQTWNNRLLCPSFLILLTSYFFLCWPENKLLAVYGRCLAKIHKYFVAQRNKGGLT